MTVTDAEQLKAISQQVDTLSSELKFELLGRLLKTISPTSEHVAQQAWGLSLDERAKLVSGLLGIGISLNLGNSITTADIVAQIQAVHELDLESIFAAISKRIGSKV